MEHWTRILRARFTEMKQSDGLTQEKLAEKMDVSQSTIANWLSGDSQPRNLKQFRRLEKTLALNPGTLTQPGATDINDDQPLYVVNHNETPYKPSIRVDVFEQAIATLVDEIGVKEMEKRGPRWTASTLILLYDLLCDEDLGSLPKDALLRAVQRLQFAQQHEKEST